MLQLTSVNWKIAKIETLVVPVCEDKDIHDDSTLSAIIGKAKKIREFSGKEDDSVTLYDLPEIKAERVIFRGLGKFKKLNAETWRVFAGKAVKECIQKDLPALWIAVPDESNFKTEMADIVEALMEGACLANHLFDKYKQEKKKKPLKRLYFVAKRGSVKKFSHIPSRVSAVCEGTLLAREWVNIPSNDKMPEQFAQMIIRQAEKQDLKIHLFNERQLRKEKFGALLAVAAGSQRKPCMLILEHRSQGAKKTVALVGKGVTFDSGGLNLKTGASIGEMKLDMSGAAAVAATLITAAKLKAKTNVIGLIPITENMPSGNATRPGDIVRSFAGKSIEIGNTDAEGRLILIDAISYGLKTYKPQVLIDLATLTGACMVALGEKIAGLFANDDDLAEMIIESGKKTHERCWRMPLPDDYKELLKSDFADINNMPSSRMGGAISAALFLSEFVGDTSWAHIDIAGTASIKKENAYCQPGGTGFGVRLLCNLIERL